MKEKYKSERSKFTVLENNLLNTFFSGLYLSSADLMNIAKKVDIPMQMNARDRQIKDLLNKSYDAGTLTRVIELLNSIIDERIQEYHRLSLDFPAAREPLVKLAQKANATKSLLGRERRGNPYE